MSRRRADSEALASSSESYMRQVSMRWQMDVHPGRSLEVEEAVRDELNGRLMRRALRNARGCLLRRAEREKPSSFGLIPQPTQLQARRASRRGDAGVLGRKDRQQEGALAAPCSLARSHRASEGSPPAPLAAVWWTNRSRGALPSPLRGALDRRAFSSSSPTSEWSWRRQPSSSGPGSGPSSVRQRQAPPALPPPPRPAASLRPARRARRPHASPAGEALLCPDEAAPRLRRCRATEGVVNEVRDDYLHLLVFGVFHVSIGRGRIRKDFQFVPVRSPRRSSCGLVFCRVSPSGGLAWRLSDRTGGRARPGTRRTVRVALGAAMPKRSALRARFMMCSPNAATLPPNCAATRRTLARASSPCRAPATGGTGWLAAGGSASRSLGWTPLRRSSSASRGRWRGRTRAGASSRNNSSATQSSQGLAGRRGCLLKYIRPWTALLPASTTSTVPPGRLGLGPGKTQQGTSRRRRGRETMVRGLILLGGRGKSYLGTESEDLNVSSRPQKTGTWRTGRCRTARTGERRTAEAMRRRPPGKRRSGRRRRRRKRRRTKRRLEGTTPTHSGGGCAG